MKKKFSLELKNEKEYDYVIGIDYIMMIFFDL